MMERWMQRLSLLIFCFFSMFAYSTQSTDEINSQLAQLKQVKDKTIAIKQAQQLIDQNNLLPKQHFSALIIQSKSYLSMSDLSNAILVTKKAKTFAAKYHFMQEQADANKLLGVSYYYQGEMHLALGAYQATLAFYDAIDANVITQKELAIIAIKRANLLNNIALVNTSMGNNIDALKNYQIAEPLYQKYGDAMDKIDIRQNIATLYISLRRYDIAIKMLKDVIKQRIIIGDDNGVADSHGDLGVAYKYSNQLDLAKQHITIALNYFKQHKRNYHVASHLHNLAEVYSEMGDYEQSKKYALQGIALSKEADHQKAYSGNLQSLARALYFQGNYTEALNTLEESNAIARKINYPLLLDSNLILSTLIYASKGETAKAIASQRAYIKSHNERNNQRLNELLARFESEKLSQKITQLQQHEKLQQLEIDKSTQTRNFVILGTILLLVVIFLVYRRSLETRLTHDLEKRVKQRTKTLEFFMQELQHANKIKSQFLANMSHEIRTPLTAVIGQAEAIINGDIDEKYLTKEVDIIHGNSLHLLQLVNDILDISKIEANKLELEAQEQDLHIIIQNLVEMFTKPAAKKGLNFSITHTLPIPFIIDIDGFRLKQILINLCSNAVKFTEQGNVNLNVSLIKNELVFTVKDTGIGMNKEQTSKIFDSFTQADGSISRRFGGSGLGLFLSEQLTIIMGGKINVTSVENEGSTFYFALPCTRHHEDDSNINLDHRIQVLPTVREGTEKKALQLYSGEIILADDHDDNRRLIARLLQGLGLDVLLASNGREAIELYEQSQAKLILLDIQMPEMDGIEAFKQLRKIGCTQPIYALTANAMSHEIEQYLALGFNGHLKKPIERKMFINTIKKYYQVKDERLPSDNTKAQTILDNIDMSDLVLQFKENLSQDKRSILSHHENGEMEALAKSVHRLAGAAQMFGFGELANIGVKLERMIKTNQKQLTDKIIIKKINELTQELFECIDQIYKAD